MLSISVVLRKYFRILLFFFIIGCHQKKTNDLKVISGYALGTSYSVTYISKSLETNLLKKVTELVIWVMLFKIIAKKKAMVS